MLRVGLTGAAGSGKSTVAALLAEAGCPIVDADRAAHDLYVPGSGLVGALAAAFGAGILRADGTVDRGALGRIVFGDATHRERLNAIVHPALEVELRRRVDALEAAGSWIAIVEAALLLQWELAGWVDLVVGVWAPREVRLARLIAGGLSPEAALLRVDAQVPDATLRHHSEILIDNSRAPADLRVEVEHLLAELKRRAASPPSGKEP